MPETISIDDLDLIFIRAQDESGRWASVSIRDATDKQMTTWAKSRVEVQGMDSHWTLEEKADFCNFLHQQSPLAMLRRKALTDTE